MITRYFHRLSRTLKGPQGRVPRTLTEKYGNTWNCSYMTTEPDMLGAYNFCKRCEARDMDYDDRGFCIDRTSPRSVGSQGAGRGQSDDDGVWREELHKAVREGQARHRAAEAYLQQLKREDVSKERREAARLETERRRIEGVNRAVIEQQRQHQLKMKQEEERRNAALRYATPAPNFFSQSLTEKCLSDISRL